MITDQLQDKLKEIQSAMSVWNEGDSIYITLKKKEKEIADYLDVFYFIADHPDEDLLKYPTLLTNMYYIKAINVDTEEVGELLKSRGFKLNPDYLELKEIEKLLRRGFNKCIEDEKKDYLDALKKMIYLQLLQVDMNHCPYLKEVFGDAPKNEALLKDVYRVVKKGHFSIGETLSCRDMDYDPNYTADYWHKTEND